MILWLVAAIAVLLAVLLVVHKAKQPKGPNLPPVVSSIPFVGPIVSFGKHPLQYMLDARKKYGDIFTVELMGKRITFLTGPKAHIAFFNASDEQLDQNEPYQFSVPIFGPNIVYGCDLNTRNQQLKFMRGSLKTDRMREYVHLIVEETEAFFREHWTDKGEVDLRECLAELIILTASRCLMGREVRERLFSEVSRLFQTLDEGLTTVSFFWPNAPIPQHRARDKARLEMASLFGGIMKERRANPDEIHNDVLQVFMDATYADGRQLGEEEVAGLMIALLFAGQHTSSVTSSWVGLHLLNSPEFLGPVIDEQEKVLEEFKELNYDALQSMDRLHRVIKECLRMNPPLIFLMRKALVDIPDVGSDYVIPKGDTLFVSPTISGRHPEFFTNPDKFDPERFGPGREEASNLKYGFVGFGGGRHGCLGETFAYLQIKTIWSVILRNYRLTALGPLPDPDYSALVVGPKAHKIRYEKIHH